MASKKQLHVQDYTVGWIAALPHELRAARYMIDEIHASPKAFTPVRGNILSYEFGNIGRHNVALSVLPDANTTNMSVGVNVMSGSLPSIRFILLVGIGGGIPRPEDPLRDIRLGDVIVSAPEGMAPGVVQYDYGKRLDDGGCPIKGILDKPARSLLAGLKMLQSRDELEYLEYLDQAIKKIRLPAVRREFSYPGDESDSKDHLFQYTCQDKNHVNCDCTPKEVVREERPQIFENKPRKHNPYVFYGTILSGNSVIKSAKERDIIADRVERDIPGCAPLCFEMEAVGLMNEFPGIVIRGICDYADGAKNDVWHKYTALVAAAYAKELLTAVEPQVIMEYPAANELLESGIV